MPKTLEFKVVRNDVPENMKRAEFGFYLFVHHMAEHLRQELGDNAPRGTRGHSGPRLFQSFHKQELSKTVYKVYSTAEHSLMVRDGTGIYGPAGSPIVPKTAGALKFFWPKVGTMTIWKGDLPKQAHGRFQAWAASEGMLPFNKWPKGQPGQDYETPSIRSTETRLPGLLHRALREMGAL